MRACAFTPVAHSCILSSGPWLLSQCSASSQDHAAHHSLSSSAPSGSLRTGEVGGRSGQASLTTEFILQPLVFEDVSVQVQVSGTEETRAGAEWHLQAASDLEMLVGEGPGMKGTRKNRGVCVCFHS